VSIVAPDVSLRGHHVVITDRRKLKITLLYRGIMFIVTFMAIGRLVLEVQRATRTKQCDRLISLLIPFLFGNECWLDRG